MVNEEEAKSILSKQDDYFCEQDIFKLQKATGASNILVTLGANGWDGNALNCHPAFTVDLVDATGAGDTFLGYCLGEKKLKNFPSIPQIDPNWHLE